MERRSVVTPHPRVHRAGRAAAQGGATTLIVVMVLFFLAALAAAYANRNLLFEQRTSANQYRSTQSFEAAEAGVEWALAQLNGGLVNAACEPDAAGASSFRNRYLVTNAGTGVVTRRLHAVDPAARLWAACTLDGDNWRCACPTGDLPDPDTMPAGAPAFAVRFANQIARPGLVRLEVNGCNTYDLACLRAEATPQPVNCNSTLCVLASLHSGLKLPPSAALTVRGDVGGTALEIYNQDLAAGGVTVRAGGNLDGGLALTLHSIPGTPPDSSKRSPDNELANLPVDTFDCLYCTFSSVFGLRPETYRQQPGALRKDCAAGCTVADVTALLANQRGRIVWLEGAAGGLTLDDPADLIGSAADPVVLVIEGALTIDAGATQAAKIHGLVYAGSATLRSGDIRGALVSTGTVTAQNDARIVYDRALLDRLRLTSGSFVRVPGSWRDFP
jgi:hypothetical protein